MRSGETKRTIIRDLGDGLVLRHGRRADAEALAELNAEVHRENEPDLEPESMKAWTRDLMSGEHPTFDPSDATIVEDTKTGAIVSSISLIPQVWSYEGIRFRGGMPELVGTRAEYRRRGLIHAQFDVIHQWAARGGQKLQAIRGIPHFYRQFGYEMAVDEEAWRSCPKWDIPALKKGEKEPCRVRRAKESDLAFMAAVYRRGMRRYLLSCVRNSALWRYELNGRRKAAVERRDLRVIETPRGERLGFLRLATSLWGWGDSFGAVGYELRPEVSWLAITPSVMRQVARIGEQHARREKKEFRRFTLDLGVEHPAYEAVPWRLPDRGNAYALYLRVPDLPDFLQHIAPVLERRLQDSVAVGHTGELKLSFYRNGLRMAFDRGRVTQVQSWQPKRGESAAFPDLTFLNLLFGRRSLEDLRAVYPDCYVANEEAAVLLAALFPRKSSSIWPVV